MMASRVMFVSRAAAVVVGLIASCGTPMRAAPPGDGSAAPLCGNGVIDHAPDPGEGCDDGANNGSPESLCSKQCASAERSALPPLPTIRLDRPTTRAVTVAFADHSWAGIAYVAAGESTIEVMPQTGSPYWETGQVPPIVTFDAGGPVIALGSVDRHPLWIVAGPQPSTYRMFWGDLGAGDTPVIHEIPYPFATGSHPTLLTSSPSASAVLVDDDGPGQDLMIAAVVVRHAGVVGDPVITSTARVARPEGTRGAIVTTTWWIDDTLQHRIQQVVIFFNDPGSFVRFDIRQPYPDLWLDSYPPESYAIAEMARAPWPYHVVSATAWFENCYPRSNPVPSLEDPMPLALLLDNGDIAIWQFLSGLTGENALPIFTHVTPGSRAIGWTTVGAVRGVWVADATGPLEVFGDSDCTSLSAPALQAQPLGTLPVGDLYQVDDCAQRTGDNLQLDIVDGDQYFTLSPGERSR